MQDRSALFFKRENNLLSPIFARCRGQLALIFGVHAQLDLKTLKMPFIFKAGPQWDDKQDVIFAADQWPLPINFFDLLVLHHPLEQKCVISTLILQAKQVLRPDGTLVITGLNRHLLKTLSALEQQDFSSKVYRFHICRTARLNRILEKIVPFLSAGFVIEARIDAISLTPLQEENLSLLMERLLSTHPAPASNVMKKGDHEA